MSDNSHHDHDDHEAETHDHHDHNSGEHSHSGGGHHHGPVDFSRAFAIGISLNLAYVAGEAFYGVIAHSMALIADAGHNLSDVLGLAGAALAAHLSKRQPGGRYTYGLRRSSIIAALANAIVLLVVTGGIAWEGLMRFFHPEPVGGPIIMVVAAAGVVINGVTALLFISGRKDDLNIKGAFMHLASDALVSLGVVLAGAVIIWTGWVWLDPFTSLVVSVVIVFGTWSLLVDSVNFSLDSVPSGIDIAKVSAYLSSLPGVTEVHDLHIWGMSTTETALTAHLIRPDASLDDALLHDAAKVLKTRFKIQHATFQVENGGTDLCALRPVETV
jgi:cobalt-zinc-cadmium efflux system protein